jgi:hypothetical protein
MTREQEKQRTIFLNGQRFNKAVTRKAGSVKHKPPKGQRARISELVRARRTGLAAMSEATRQSSRELIRDFYEGMF